MRRGAAMILTLSVMACEAPSAPESAFSDQAQPSGAEAGAEEPAQGGGPALEELTPLPRLDGQWLHLSEVSTCVDLGSSIEQLNRSLYLVSVTQRPNGGLIERWEACEIELTPVISIQASVPEALRASVYPIELHQGQATGLGLERRYSSGALVELWGLSLEEPVTEPFPTEPSDERIFDSDADGQPGATLMIGSACEAYLAQRRVTHFMGAQVGFGRLEGEAISSTEQLIIDASSPICKTPYQTRDNPARSRWVRVRVDGQGGAYDLDLDGDGTLRCDELASARAELFELLEPDDERCRVQ